jgi:plastocyanin
VTWTRLTGAAAVWTALLMLGIGIYLTDLEAIAIGVGLFVGVVLLGFRKGLLGRLALLVLFADVAVWMVPAAVTNIAHGEDLTAVAAPLAIGAVALLGLIADIVLLVTRSRAEKGAGRVVALAALLVVGSVVASQLELFGEPVEAREGDIVVWMRDVEFDPDDILANGRTVTLVVENADLFWHTLTIEELDVDVRVPVKARRRTTFIAPPGTYEFICAIPGHDAAGMNGTLVVP